jgi:phage pi2 protein 07
MATSIAFDFQNPLYTYCLFVCFQSGDEKKKKQGIKYLLSHNALHQSFQETPNHFAQSPSAKTENWIFKEKKMERSLRLLLELAAF